MSVPADFFNGREFVPMRVVEIVTTDLDNNCLVTPTTSRGGDIMWHYKHKLGIFKDDGVSYVRDKTKELLGDHCKTAHVNEVVFLSLIETYIKPDKFIEDPNLVVLKNGVYHLNTGELTEHDWLHFAKNAMPIDYDPDATCPEIIKFLGEVIPDAVETFQEWIGYHLYKDMIYHKAAMFIGDGANGKTTLQDVMNAFLGHDNISQVGLYNLVSNRFATSELYLKLANISPEIASDELKRTGRFKALTGHDRIRAEKKYRDAFSFTNYAKLTFLCNQMPTTPDKTSAFFRRWLIFVFPNKFEGVNCDSKILEKLTTPEELSGLFNWVLEGLTRLLATDRFTKSMSSDELQAMYESMSDPITAFIEKHLIMSTSGAELKDDVYRAYYEFCRDKGYVAVTTRTFTMELKPRIAGLAESLRKIKGRKGRCWVGIRLTLDTQDTLDTHPITTSLLDGKEVIDRSVSIVSCVSKDSDMPEGPDEEEDHNVLIMDAVRILTEHGKSMPQVKFFKAFIVLGYHHHQASELLRADPRFRFMGDTVSLID